MFTNPTDRVRVRRVTSRCRVAGARPFSWAPSLPGWQNNESKPEARGFTNSDGDFGGTDAGLCGKTGGFGYRPGGVVSV